MGNLHKFFPLEPYVRLSDLLLLDQASWANIDTQASTIVGTPCVGIPSVRVGMTWALEYFGFNRFRDHVLVPKFLGRCVLNSLNRFALPVETLTKQTRLVVVVHQYGLKQNTENISRICSNNNLHYIEDSPFGIEKNESISVDSFAKFIGLSKILPVIKGAILLSLNSSFVEFVKQKRQEFSMWSFFVFASLAYLRARNTISSYSPLADATYEMFLQSKGDNWLLRGNILRALDQFHKIASQSAHRLEMIKDQLLEQVMIPNTDRISNIVPFFPPPDQRELAQIIFRKHGFDSGIYHIDTKRNIFSPQYEKALLLPLNPRIPTNHFQALIEELSNNF